MGIFITKVFHWPCLLLFTSKVSGTALYEKGEVLTSVFVPEASGTFLLLYNLILPTFSMAKPGCLYALAEVLGGIRVPAEGGGEPFRLHPVTGRKAACLHLSVLLSFLTPARLPTGRRLVEALPALPASALPCVCEDALTTRPFSLHRSQHCT